MMNKSVVTSQALMDDAAAYFINLKNTGAWKTKVSRNSRIIALTTQLTELKTEIGKLSASKATPKLDDGKPAGGPAKYVFQLWRLEKIDNKAEHNMVERDGKTWYWCDKHRYNNKGVITNGMYVTHKPDEHGAWINRRNKGRKVVQRLQPEMTLLTSPPQPLLSLTTLLPQSSPFQNCSRLHW